MRPSMILMLASAGFCAIGIWGLYGLGSKEVALAMLVTMAFASFLQSDVTEMVAKGASTVTVKLLTQAVELRDEIDDLDEIISEAIEELRCNNKESALNILTAGAYLKERRENG